MRLSVNIHEKLWGSERWVCSAHPASPSVILDGDYKGRALNEFCQDFPLLMKVICAKERLSLQVHPNEESCNIVGGSPKSEMWCALSDGFVYAGLKAGTTEQDVRRAIKDGNLEELMSQCKVKAGDVLYIPGGLVHAIGENTELFEVQQCSTTTFRLCDWGRVGMDGRPRELHIEKALKVIDYNLPPPKTGKHLDTVNFRFHQEFLNGERTFSTAPDTFIFVYSANMGGLLVPPSSSEKIQASGESFLVTEFTAVEHKVNRG